VKRCRGIGNVVMLLPVLDWILETGCGVELITRAEWVDAFAVLRPGYDFGSVRREDTVDLDTLTQHTVPSKHRTQEFSELLGISSPLFPPRLAPPRSWVEMYREYEGLSTVVFAPEVGHPARAWPLKKVQRTCALLTERNYLVLVGNHTAPALPCRKDLRGMLDLKGLIGFLSTAGTVVTMDSGCLHLANALSVPCVCIFGGVDPRYRIHRAAKCVAIQANISCSPCNKLESCNGSYDCLESISPVHVLKAIEIALSSCERVITRV
jgi:ADP-heptose:LPS heptosyltransferase